jgi:hypothetical protein
VDVDADRRGYLQVQVWVKDQDFPGDYGNYMSSAVVSVGTGPVTAVSLTSNQTAPLTRSMPITWTAQGTGGTAPLQHRFYLYDLETGTWDDRAGLECLSAVHVDAGAADMAVHALQVWVKSTGAADWEAYVGTGYFVIVP